MNGVQSMPGVVKGFKLETFNWDDDLEDLDGDGRISLGWKETQWSQNIGIEDSQGKRIVEQSQVLKIWENYITELHDRPNRPATLEVEPEEEVDPDEKGPYILWSEVEKAIKEMRNTKATGDDDVPGDMLKLFGKGSLKIMTKLINTTYETGEWPKDFTEVTMIALKKPQATKCSDPYNDCLKEEATSYKMQRPSPNQPYRTYSEDSSKDT